MALPTAPTAPTGPTGPIDIHAIARLGDLFTHEPRHDQPTWMIDPPNGARVRVHLDPNGYWSITLGPTQTPVRRDLRNQTVAFLHAADIAGVDIDDLLTT